MQRIRDGGVVVGMGVSSKSCGWGLALKDEEELLNKHMPFPGNGEGEAQAYLQGGKDL